MHTRQSSAVGSVGLILCEMLIVATQVTAQPIPTNRTTDWSYAGVPGGIPTYPVCVTLGVAGQASTYLQSTVTPAVVTAALASCASSYPNGSAVVLSPGTYAWSESLRLNVSKVVLRGSGADQTIITHAANVTQTISSIGGYDPGGGTITAVDIAIAGATKGGFSFVVASVGSLSSGQIIVISKADESFVYTKYPGRAHAQTNKITNISGTGPYTVTLRNPLIFDFTTGTPKVTGIVNNVRVGIGLEDLKLDHSAGLSGNASSLWVGYCDSCWVKGIESYMSRSFHIAFNDPTLNCEVRDSFIHRDQTPGNNNSGIRAAGVDGSAHSHAKFENNIFDRNFPAIELNYGGSAGIVVAYNFVARPESYGPVIHVTWSLDDGHAPHPMFNLYEGNIAPAFGSDGYYGSSSHGTLFRNLITGATPGDDLSVTTGLAIQLMRFSYYYNIVGNVIGSAETNPPAYEYGGESWITPPYQFGYPNIGNTSLTPYDGWFPVGQSSYPDVNVRSTLLRWGNYDFYHKAVRWEPSEIPTGLRVPSSQSLPDSYVYTRRPSWWPSTVAWPPIGPDVSATTRGGVGTLDASGHANKTPSQLCFETRNLISGGTFNASACYGAAPAPPANVKIR